MHEHTPLLQPSRPPPASMHSSAHKHTKVSPFLCFSFHKTSTDIPALASYAHVSLHAYTDVHICKISVRYIHTHCLRPSLRAAGQAMTLDGPNDPYSVHSFLQVQQINRDTHVCFSIVVSFGVFSWWGDNEYIFYPLHLKLILKQTLHVKILRHYLVWILSCFLLTIVWFLKSRFLIL